MAISKYPAELTDPVWQKKKSATAGKTGIGEELKKLTSGYTVINWKLFEDLEKVSDKEAYDKSFKPANSEFSKVNAYAQQLYKFRDFAKKQAETMKAITNKNTKTLLESMAKTADQLGIALKSECSDLLKSAQEAVDDYPQRLQGWVQRRVKLRDDFNSAKQSFDLKLTEAKKLAKESDDLAIGAAKSPKDAKAYIQEMIVKSTTVDKIGKELKKKNGELHIQFDPFRGATESASTHKIAEIDAKPYAQYFTEADNLRKDMVGIQEEVEEIFKESITSIKQAQTATLEGGSQSAAYLKIAEGLAKSYGGLGKTMTSAPGAKSIMGKGTPYKDSWKTFIGSVTGAKQEDRAKLKPMAKDRMKQRKDQVDELEKQLETIYNTANTGFTKGLAGIPEKTRDGDIKKQIQLAQDGLNAGKEFLELWKKDNADAQSTYLEAIKAIDQG